MNLAHELKWLWALAALAAAIACGSQVDGQSTQGDDDFYEGPGVMTADILRARGYHARDLHVRSRDGYMLRVTRGCNPLINGCQGGLPGRVPILFIHGILESYNVFVVNSFDARPSDFSNISLSQTSLDDLRAQLGDVPSAKALPLLAMDFGHEVFILSRRGFPGSQKLTGDPISGDDSAPSDSGSGPLSAFLLGLTNNGNLLQEIPFSFDRKFWNFSLDEQARYDFPQILEFICNQTGRNKIAVVAHSAGGTITLQALSQFPELNNKLAAVILWAEGFSLGHGDVFNLLPAALPFLQTYVGSVPPAFTTNQIQALLGLFCATQAAQSTLCEGVADLILGFSAGQEPIRPEFINSLLYPSSSHELAQNIQAVLLGGQTHHYANNLTRPQPYDLSAITNKRLSFWTSTTDTIVSMADVRATLPLLRVPYQFHLIDTTFNHNGYFYHKNTSRLAIIPTLREIALLSQAND